MLPPSVISRAARCATAVNEKQEMFIVMAKFSAVVST